MPERELDGVMDTISNKADSDDEVMNLVEILCGPEKDAQPGRVPGGDLRRFAPTEQMDGIQSPNVRPRFRW